MVGPKRRDLGREEVRLGILRSASCFPFQGLQEGLLNRVLGILPIVQDVLSNSEELAIVSPHELLESRYVSLLAGMNKLQVITCNCAHCELCQGCSHIRLR